LKDGIVELKVSICRASLSQVQSWPPWRSLQAAVEAMSVNHSVKGVIVSSGKDVFNRRRRDIKRVSLTPSSFPKLTGLPVTWKSPTSHLQCPFEDLKCRPLPPLMGSGAGTVVSKMCLACDYRVNGRQCQVGSARSQTGFYPGFGGKPYVSTSDPVLITPSSGSVAGSEIPCRQGP